MNQGRLVTLVSFIRQEGGLHIPAYETFHMVHTVLSDQIKGELCSNPNVIAFGLRLKVSS